MDDPELVGRWVIDPFDVEAIEVLGQANLEFRSDGSLVYSVVKADRIQTMFLTYRVSGDELITNQPSAPLEERTRFSFTQDGCLALTFRNQESGFGERVEKPFGGRPEGTVRHRTQVTLPNTGVSQCPRPPKPHGGAHSASSPAAFCRMSLSISPRASGWSSHSVASPMNGVSASPRGL